MGKKQRPGQRTPNFVDPINIGFDRLQILIQEFAQRISDKWLWLAPFGIAVTLAATLMVSDFTDRGPLKAIEWRDGTIALLVIFSIMTIWAIMKGMQRQSLEDLMDLIGSECISPVRNYALTYFRARDANGVSLVLVYFDTTWNCYLMPFVSLQPGQSDPTDVSEYSTPRFNLPKTAFWANELDGLEVRSDKVSVSSGKMTNYRFSFYLMKIEAKHQTSFLRREFDVQERQYKWLTIEQLLADQVSMDRNGEIFKFMRDNPRGFFSDKLPTSVDKPMEA